MVENKYNEIKHNRFFKNWTRSLVTIDSDSVDIVVIKTSSKISKMSRRKQKLALSKNQKTVFKNCYPKSITF